MENNRDKFDVNYVCIRTHSGKARGEFTSYVGDNVELVCRRNDGACFRFEVEIEDGDIKFEYGILNEKTFDLHFLSIEAAKELVKILSNNSIIGVVQ